MLTMGVRRRRKKLWLGLWNETFNEYKSIMLIKILTLIKKKNDRSKRFWVT